MRFYTFAHQFYCGSALHARTMYIRMLRGGAVNLDPWLDPEPAAKASCGIVGFSTVVIHEDTVIAAIAEERAAKIPDLGRRFDPARSLPIELSQLLQLSILMFREQLDAYRGCRFDGASPRFVFCS